jgi:hypothetical protein
VANKIDLRDQMRAEGKRVIEQAEGAKLAKVCFKKSIFMEFINSTFCLLGIQRIVY